MLGFVQSGKRNLFFLNTILKDITEFREYGLKAEIQVER